MPIYTDLKVPVCERDHAVGPCDAPVEMVVYVDYECPICVNSEPIVKQLRQQFDDRLRVVFRYFPQHSVHPHASAAAQAAEAAAAQGKFWEMHSALFAHQGNLADVDYTHLALQLGLDPYRFERDIEGRHLPRRVSDDHTGGLLSGVSRTPTFFVNGRRHDGNADFNTLLALITAELS